MTLPIIELGSTGMYVEYLQQLLTALGYNPGPIDGIFGPKTKAAVIAFQKVRGLVVDGIVGNNTWTHLPIIPVNTLLKVGSTGEDVRYLQQLLNILGYNSGSPDGIFGPKTLTAVKAFQTAKGLVVDGIVGNNTWAAIDNAIAAILTIKDYFSFVANTKYVYAGVGSEYASYDVLIDYLTGNLAQLRCNNGGTETVQVLENKNGNLTMLLSRAECYYRENLLQAPSVNAEILLREPLVKGTTWTLWDKRIRYISNVEVPITTPLGVYETLEVTTDSATDRTIQYYAPNIGLVKTVFVVAGGNITSTLSQIQKNVVFNQTIEFFYPNLNGVNLDFVFKQLTFQTNDVTKTIIEASYKDLPKGNICGVLSPNTEINSIMLGDPVVDIDFSKELVSQMNAKYESMILQCITNTFGIYYAIANVEITVAGNPYVSSHIVMKKGQTMQVNLKYCIQLI